MAKEFIIFTRIPCLFSHLVSWAADMRHREAGFCLCVLLFTQDQHTGAIFDVVRKPVLVTPLPRGGSDMPSFTLEKLSSRHPNKFLGGKSPATDVCSTVA